MRPLRTFCRSFVELETKRPVEIKDIMPPFSLYINSVHK